MPEAARGPAADSRPAPAEERSYLAFAAVALALTLGAGLPLGVASGLAETGAAGWGPRLPGLVEAHAWVQLQGWIGLFVAGMGLRLVPRLAGRRPLPRPVALAVLMLLAAGAAGRVLAATAVGGTAGGVVLVAADAASAAGALLLAGGLTVALVSRGRAWQPWRLAAWAGTGWWAVWAALTIAGAAAARGGVVPARLDAVTAWVAVLGPFSNFVWAIQARSVPVFYGRRAPGVAWLGPLLLLLNGGAALVAASALTGSGLGAGLALAGAAGPGLAAVAGSLGGRAVRLRPGALPAARFVVAGNRWAALAGLLLVASAFTTAGPLRDAALHALGLGFMTTLILGMAQLLTPAFAGERATGLQRRPETWLSWPALMLAAALRVLAAFATGTPRVALIATAGTLAWVAIAAFATGFLRAARSWRP